ncbi:MAG: hypothetical protein AB1Y25_09535 [Cycloclasticus sp.]
MFNHSSKILMLCLSSLLLTACHKAAILDDKLALETLRQLQPAGYAINIVSNNPNAYAQTPSGWQCSDMQAAVDAELVNCHTAGRSGAYLSFTENGKKLIVGEPWGDSNLKNARVIAVSKRIESINSISFTSKTSATVNYNWVYQQYTAFASEPLKKLIPLNTLQSATTKIVLLNKQWQIQP